MQAVSSRLSLCSLWTPALSGGSLPGVWPSSLSLPCSLLPLGLASGISWEVEILENQPGTSGRDELLVEGFLPPLLLWVSWRSTLCTQSSQEGRKPLSSNSQETTVWGNDFWTFWLNSLWEMYFHRHFPTTRTHTHLKPKLYESSLPRLCELLFVFFCFFLSSVIFTLMNHLVFQMYTTYKDVSFVEQIWVSATGWVRSSWKFFYHGKKRERERESCSVLDAWIKNLLDHLVPGLIIST